MLISSRIAILFALLWSFTLQQSTPSWNYDRRGPDIWPQISSMCGGDAQSPINIDTSRVKYDTNLRPLSLNGYVTNASIYSWNFTHNGYTIVVYPLPLTRLSISGANLTDTYYLNEFHLHWGLNPGQGSEHTINGEKYPLEIQFVHQASVSRATVILSVLFKIQPNDNPYLEEFLAILNETIDASIFSVHTIDLSPLFPTSSNPHFFRYEGSFTTPPCTEGVTWIILERTVGISEAQLEVFAFNSVPSNFRPPQKLKEREVLGNYRHDTHGHAEGHGTSGTHAHPHGETTPAAGGSGGHGEGGGAHGEGGGHDEQPHSVASFADLARSILFISTLLFIIVRLNY